MIRQHVITQRMITRRVAIVCGDSASYVVAMRRVITRRMATHFVIMRRMDTHFVISRREIMRQPGPETWDTPPLISSITVDEVAKAPKIGV